MESFVWNECFITGLPKVDEQHQRLVELINGFGEGLMEEPGVLLPQLEAVFAELADYARGHFQDEEALMAAAKAAGGKVLGSSRHPLNTADFSSYLLQAQQFVGDGGAKGLPSPVLRAGKVLERGTCASPAAMA